MEFRIAKHTETEEDVVEVWKDGEFIASIYDHEEGLRIVSKYLNGVKHEAKMPQSVVIKLMRGLWTTIY